MEPQDVDFNDPSTPNAANTSPQDDIKALIAELRSLAFSDIGGMYDENNCLKDIKDIPESLRRAIASIETDEIWSGTGHAREVIGHTKRVKLWAKDGSIEKFMKHLGMFIERLETKTTVTVQVQQFDLDERLDLLRGRN